MKRVFLATVLAAMSFLVVQGTVQAAPFSIMVGDNDGYGQGVADNGTGGWASTTPLDWRSAAEQGATDGSEATDIYGALWDSPATPVDVIFNLTGNMASAVLTVDMADAQAVPIGISYNGVAQSSWVYNDGFQATAVRSYVLDTTSIANANAAGQFVLTIGTNAPVYDYLAFDYFKLEGRYVNAIPEPTTMLLFGVGLAGLAGVVRRKR